MADHIGMFDVSGAFMPRPSNSDTDVSGSLNIRHSVERKLYNRLLTGDALKTEVGESRASGDSNLKATSPSWTQDKAGLRHGFVISGLSSSLHETQLNTFVSGVLPLESSAVPASATMFYGKSQLVTKTYKLTGSDAITGLDYFLTDPVTGSLLARFSDFPDVDDLIIDVPDSGSLVDIKVWVELVTRFGRVINDPGGPTYVNNNTNFPSTPYLNRRVDGFSENFFIPTSKSVDLSDMSIYLIPPNNPLRDEIGPRFAYPGWNDPNGINALKNVDAEIIENSTNFIPFDPLMGRDGNPLAVPRSRQGSKAGIWDGTYVLWEGKRSFLDVFNGMWGSNLSQSITPAQLRFVPGSSSLYDGFSVNSASYVNWDSDFNMRTVFCDSSPNPNPLHLDRLYNFSSSSLSSDPVIVLSASSPNEKALRVYSGSFYGQPLTASAYGLQFPWFVDDRLSGFLGNIVSASSPISGWNSIGFPPDGWLTGGKFVVTQSLLAGNVRHGSTRDYDYAATQVEASGFTGGVIEDDGINLYYRWYMHSASDNEWPTRGRNLGPATIKPVMPLLDDIYTETMYRDPISYSNDPLSRTGGVLGVRSTMDSSVILRGFRPGLRGAEINGKWRLVVKIPSDVAQGGYRYEGYYFRQWRLELTFRQGKRPVGTTLLSKTRRHERSSSGYKPGFRLIHVMSGARVFPFHHGVEKYYVAENEEYGRTVGITSNTGSVNDFAVFTRVTGTLADRLTGSAGFFSSFLGNEFGTPYLPISSGSGIPPASQIFDDPIVMKEEQKTVHEAINPRTLVPPANTAKSTLSRTDYASSTADRVTRKLSILRSSQSGSV